MFIQRAEMLMDAKRYEDARVQFLNAIASDPEEASAYCRLGVCCSLLGMNAEALEYGSKAVSLKPEWSDVHYQLAWIYNRIGEKYKAEQSARNALACEPDFAEALLLMGWTFLDRSRLEEALVTAEQVIALQPDNADAFNLQGLACLRLGKLDDGQQALEQALRFKPENPTSLANLGYVDLQRGDWATAEEHFRDALRLDPHYEFARLGVSEILRASNPAFRWISVYRYWLDRQPVGFSWIVVFLLLMIGYGIAFLFRVDLETGNRMLAFAPILLAFAVTGTFIEPISQAFALLTTAGRLLATRWEAVGGLLLTLYLLIWGTVLIAGIGLKLEYLQGIALVTGYAYLTFVQTWRSDLRWVRISMVVVSMLVVVMLGAMVVLSAFESTRETEAQIAVMGIGVFLIGLLSLLMPTLFYRIFYQPDP
ncbi:MULTISPECIES: tetratricopeptide repeat protein [Pirellulaceae]|uniref:tetratricopeptide repeat protein n=1 Tax=Pirellulaceae TaxID=2691357 RepID=UPI001304B994|nr:MULTISPECIES: tetratricopeptide repeat protein [Pirellulaceae]